MEKIYKFDLDGQRLTAANLEMILRTLETEGAITVINCAPGGARLLEIGAYLAETAQRMANDRKKENS